ncbi:hypothetical protein LX77_01784 [Gelidibacter algens]|uniref:Uncharacterized protein n=1 Tax=Gelidibacter algens TaxID=49280 RepID=A0A327S7N5_9FLAO|nr:hypothetical protein [Gelidibacter algens]RAJ24788.1 hypothetical protein LX77_01784 [Gelidibacter algens]
MSSILVNDDPIAIILILSLLITVLLTDAIYDVIRYVSVKLLTYYRIPQILK